MSNYLTEFSKFLREQSEKKERIVIIDGLNLFMRNYQVNPTLNDNGEHIGGILGVYRSIKKIINDYSPNSIYCILDGKGGSERRRKIYKEYKANRISIGSFNRFEDTKELIDEAEALRNQVRIFAEMLDLLPINSISIDGIEADDCIAYLVTTALPEDSEKIIISNDKDFLQLINENVSIYTNTKKILINSLRIKELYGYTPLNYLTLRCFTGDSSDNIDGIKKVGPKSMNKYFNLDGDTYITIDDIVNECYKQIENGSKLTIYKNIVENKDIAYRNFKLMQLQDVDISAKYKSIIRNLAKSKVPKLDKKLLQELFYNNRIFDPIQDVAIWNRLFLNLK